MKLPINVVNKGVFYCVTVLLIFYTYYMMVYAAQDLSLDEDSTNNNLTVHILRVSVILFTLFTLIINRFKVYKSDLSIAIVLWVFWMLLSNLAELERYVINLTFVLLWPSVFFLFGLFRMSKLSSKYFYRLCLLLFVITSTFYLYVMQLMNLDLDGRLASVNHIYYILLLIPWVLLIPNNQIKNTLIIVAILLTLYSAKRGAILAMSLVGIVYFYFTYFNSFNRKLKFRSILLGIGAFCVLAFIFVEINNSSGGYLIERFKNISEDEGSGRLGIYNEVIYVFNRSPIESKIFGHGHNMVKSSISYDLSAHNDYLEVLYNHGIVGFILLIWLLFILAWRVYKLYIIKSKLFISYFSAFLIFLFMTMISHIILYPTYIIFLFSYLGFVDYPVTREVKRK